MNGDGSNTSSELVKVPRELLADLIGAVRSINRGKAHEVKIPGDDEPRYWQRKEWVDWALEVAENLASEVDRVNGVSHTLSEKQAELRLTVAMPTAEDWRLLESNEEKAVFIVTELNNALVFALDYAKNGSVTWGQIAEAFFPKLRALHAAFPKAGLTDSAVFETVARFFAVNFSPAMYDFLRYYGADHPV